MSLTAEEKAWVANKLNTYDIKFQEIYDELKDHLLTAIEQARFQGDTQPVEAVFAKIVKEQFPGFWPFEGIVKQYEVAYSTRIKKAIWANFRYYLNWQTIPVLVLMVVAGIFMPLNKATTITMMVILLAAAVVPMVYTYISSLKIKTEKGKESLLKNYVLRRSNFLALIINVIFNGVGALGRNWEPAAFLSPAHYAPVVFMLMIGFFFIYGLSCIRLTRTEFKMDDQGV